MASVSRKEGVMSSPAGGPEPRTGALNKDISASPGCWKGSFIFARANCYNQLVTILWEVIHNQMGWTPGKEEGNQFLPATFSPAFHDPLRASSLQSVRRRHAMAAARGVQHIRLQA